MADAIVTLAGEDATAMLLEGDRVVATGRADDLTGVVGARIVDHRGSTILPGLNDAHVHLMMMVLMAQGVDLSAETTPDAHDLERQLTAAAARAGAGAWIRGFRYDHTRTTGGRIIDREDLDRWCPGHPVVVGHVGAHWGVASSRALEAAGIADATPDPVGGEYGRDPSGRLTGYLSEQAYFDFAYPSLSQRPQVVATIDQDVVGHLQTAVQRLLAAGITSIGDAMIGPDELRLLSAAASAGRLPLRVNALVTFPHVDWLIAEGVTSGHGDDWLRVGGVKVFADGAVAGRSCAVAEPFEGTDDLGILTTDQDLLTELARTCHAAGLALAIHANGERAIEIALSSLEDAGPLPGPHRDRIEHCSIITEALLRRMRRLEVMAVPFGGYPYYHGEKLLDWYGPARLERMFAHRSLLDAGIDVAGSSDYPCGPLEPFAGLQSCVTRTSASGTPVGRSQRITLDEALRLYTVGSATVEGQAHQKGRLQTGHLADFIVVDADPRTVDPYALAQIEVQATWVGGEQRWAAS